MNTLQFAITIYIHPDKGPISGMQLDMLSIETAVMKSSAGTKNDDARLEMIAEMIKKKFPQVEPQRKLNELRYLIARLTHVSMFDGVVLQLPGIIDGDAPVQQQQQGLAVEDYQKLIKEATDLKVQLQVLHDEVNAANALMLKWEKRVIQSNEQIKRLIDENELLREEAQEKETELQEAQAQVERLRKAAQKYKDRADQLVQEQTQFQTEIEQAQRDRQEIAMLRRELASAQRAEQQVREALERCEQELNDYRDRLRRVAEQLKTGPNDSKPWEP